MKVDILVLDKVVQLRIPDSDMSKFDNLENMLKTLPNVKFIKKSMTFETPIIDYEYQGIEFSLLFDEQESETFIVVPKPFDYQKIQKFIESLS
ncbi:hypothetical protein [Caproiciproducens sp. LBM24188]